MMSRSIETLTIIISCLIGDCSKSAKLEDIGEVWGEFAMDDDGCQLGRRKMKRLGMCCRELGDNRRTVGGSGDEQGVVKGGGYDWSMEAVEGVRFSCKVGGSWRVLFSFSDSIYFFLFSFLFVFEYFLFFSYQFCHCLFLQN